VEMAGVQKTLFYVNCFHPNPDPVSSMFLTCISMFQIEVSTMPGLNMKEAIVTKWMARY
jgi:hypothetical protein